MTYLTFDNREIIEEEFNHLVTNHYGPLRSGEHFISFVKTQGRPQGDVCVYIPTFCPTDSIFESIVAYYTNKVPKNVGVYIRAYHGCSVNQSSTPI